VGLLLAAGRGTRFDPAGRLSKLMVPLDGMPLAVRAARHALEVLPRVVAVVPADSAGPQTQALTQALSALGCELLVSAAPDAGMGDSLALGAGFLLAQQPAPAGCLVLLADMPAVRSATIARVAHAILDGSATAAPVFGGRRGHPVGFSAVLLPRLRQLGGDRGAHRVLEAFPPRRVPVEDPGVLIDVDTAEDLARLLASSR
jgi:molybdenum cofactor cytidylyltransferase